MDGIARYFQLIADDQKAKYAQSTSARTLGEIIPGADLFLNIRVKPSANLGRLEEVLVITRKEDRAPSVAETNSVRAVDILTQRLPSVPDKPAVDASQAATETPAKPAAVPKPVPSAKKASQETAKPTATAAPAQPVASQPAPSQPGTSEDKPH